MNLVAADVSPPHLIQSDVRADSRRLLHRRPWRDCPCLQGRGRSARGRGRGDFGWCGHRQTIAHRREGAGEAGNENPARLASTRRPGEGRAPIDQKGTLRFEMVGAKIRGQRRVLPEARN